MLLAAVLAGFALACAADVTAKPPLGTEKATLPTGDMRVLIKDEGTTGIHLKPYSSKKSGLAPAKKEQIGLKASIKDEGATGAHLKEPTGNGVPPLKHISFANSDKSHKKEEKHDESPDFEDTPLVAAASSQTSRINVKKGPNGQEYEYEYVYYYYDDEDEEGKGGAKTDKPVASKTERPSLQDEEPSLSPRQEAKSHIRQDVKDQDKEEDIRQISRQELRDEPKDERNDGRQEDLVHEGRQGSFRKEAKQDLRDEKRTDHFRQDTRDNFRQDYKDENRQDLRYEGRQSLRSEGRIRQGLDEKRGFEQKVDEPVRHRGSDSYEERRQEGRGRIRGQQQDARPEEERRRRPVQPVEDNSAPSRSRYTTIERGRGKNSDITTVEPSSNEVLPTRSPSRGRQPVEAVEEERLPSNPRFPGRSRGSATTEPPPSRSRGSASGGSVRRPSLVDSSSFRTHSSDAAPEEDQGGYLSSAAGNTRESDLEEYIRPTTFQPQSVQTTLPPLQPSSAPSTIVEDNDQEMPAKAALDLYAILQQTQEENSVIDSDYGTTNIPTTDPPTTTPEPTTTPTTTTTTTTTTPPPPPEPTKRGRFRSGGSRTRVRSKGSTTTTTEAAPEEEASQRPKFKPSHSRSPGQVSAYGRRRSSAGAVTASPTTEATQQSTRARNNFQSGGNRYRTRGRVSTTSAPVEDEEEPSEEAESTSTTAKPRVRIGGTAGARPLRPGPRLNLRPLRPGASTTAAPPPAASPEAPVEQEVATTPEAPPHSEGDSLTKLRSRPRLKVQSIVPQTRPFNNQRRPLIGLNNRRRTTESEASAETTTQSSPVETETPPPSSTEPQPHTTENKLASLIGRRRPINRRLPIQPAGDH